MGIVLPSCLRRCWLTDWLTATLLLALASRVILTSESQGTHESQIQSHSHKVTLRLTVYRQSIRLGAKPLEITTRDWFLKVNPCGYSPYVTSPLLRGWICLLWIGFTFVKCMYPTYSLLLKILPFARLLLSCLVVLRYPKPWLKSSRNSDRNWTEREGRSSRYSC
jgi:hypothetical protein